MAVLDKNRKNEFIMLYGYKYRTYCYESGDGMSIKIPKYRIWYHKESLFEFSLNNKETNKFIWITIEDWRGETLESKIKNLKKNIKLFSLKNRLRKGRY